jgi:hypothetical protein
MEMDAQDLTLVSVVFLQPVVAAVEGQVLPLVQLGVRVEEPH